MKFDLEKDGLETVLQPWQAEVMRIVWKTEDEVDSRTAYNSLRESGTPMSRASVISFLNRMVGEGFLEYREATGKGGHKRLYRPTS
ncbi:MAG: BlaI/MecI/CopY family transcriptional regulator, partial [Candidatus Hodarchaeales archaeon]